MLALQRSAVVRPAGVRGHNQTNLVSRGIRATVKGRAQAWQLQAMVLRPTGDGSSDHLDAEVQPPGIIKLIEGLQEVGRESPADVVCAVPTVSSRHAMIRVEGSEVSITDLNSTNGTMVRLPRMDRPEELEPLEWIVLPVGSEVVFGDVHLARFELVDTGE